MKKNGRGWALLLACTTVAFLLIAPASPADAAVTTSLVKNINTSPTGGGDDELGPGDSRPNRMIAFGGHVYFRGQDAGNQVELYRTDGTTAGTALFKDLNGTESSFPIGFTVVGSTMYFSATVNGASNLWKTDGTSAGTIQVPKTGTMLDPVRLTNVGGTLFFVASDGDSANELFKVDGTGTAVKVKDIAASNPFGGFFLNELTDLNGILMFNANDGVNGSNLWRSDGTEAGTFMVEDINTTGFHDEILGVTKLGNRVYFEATNGSGQTGLYYADGNVGSAELFLSPVPGGAAQIQMMHVAGPRLYFSAVDPDAGYELFVTDGNISGTGLVKDINPGDNNSAFENVPAESGALGNDLYFAATNGTDGVELWKTDGTEDNTEMVENIRPGSAGSNPTDFAELDGVLYFSANDGTNGFELWSTDGTPEGTSMVSNINPSTAANVEHGPTDLEALGTTALIFSADDGTSGRELWKASDAPLTTAPSLTISDASGVEGDADSTFTFTVTASHARTTNFKVTIRTVNGTATAPSDFVAVPPTVLVFTPGQTTKTQLVTIKGDLTDEDPLETFNVTLTSPVGATIADGVGVGSITEDSDPQPQINIGDVTKREADAVVTFKFPVSLTAISGKEITVHFKTSDGTAIAPGDYTPKEADLTFAPGTKDLDINVAIKVRGDGKRELTETFFVDLSLPTPTPATIADAQAVGTIKNDD